MGMRFTLDDIATESTPIVNSTFVAYGVKEDGKPIGAVLISPFAMVDSLDAVRPFIVDHLNALLEAGTPEDQLRAALAYVLRIA
jgi:hypothetical protein